MDEDATWYGGRPRPRPHCARWGPSSHPQKRAQPRVLTTYVTEFYDDDYYFALVLCAELAYLVQWLQLSLHHLALY